MDKNKEIEHDQQLKNKLKQKTKSERERRRIENEGSHHSKLIRCFVYTHVYLLL